MYSNFTYELWYLSLSLSPSRSSVRKNILLEFQMNTIRTIYLLLQRVHASVIVKLHVAREERSIVDLTQRLCCQWANAYYTDGWPPDREMSAIIFITAWYRYYRRFGLKRRQREDSDNSRIITIIKAIPIYTFDGPRRNFTVNH